MTRVSLLETEISDPQRGKNGRRDNCLQIRCKLSKIVAANWKALKAVNINSFGIFQDKKLRAAFSKTLPSWFY